MKKSSKHKTNPDITILRALLNAKPGFVSGNDLADKLGISRVAVWGRLKKLREKGIELDAFQNRGYSLSKEPKGLHPKLLEAYWKKKPPFKIFHHEVLDSTNAEVDRLLANGENTPFVVIANRQTAGKGRQGKSWKSSDVQNLYISFAFSPNMSLEKFHLFTPWIGLQSAKYLTRKNKTPVSVKWPNDLYIDLKKIGGILTEAKIQSGRIASVTLGIGINVNLKKIPKELKGQASSLAIETNKQIPIHKFTKDFIEHIHSIYQQYLEEDVQDELIKNWPDYDLLHERPIKAQVGKQTVAGKGAGIDSNAHLLIRRRNGKITPIHSGEILFR